MSGAPFWIDGVDDGAVEWDSLLLGDVILPGVVTNVDIGHEVDIDVGKAQGNSGAPTTVKGRQPRPIKITFKMWKQDDWLSWQEDMKSLGIFGKTQSFQPYAIQHPATLAYGVDNVLIKGSSFTYPSPIEGMTVTIDCLEFIKPLPIKQSNTAKKSTKTDPANDPSALVENWPSDQLG